MKCPFCNHEDTQVKDSRPAESAIRRRRHCPRCDSRFTTYERVQLRDVVILKKTGVKEVFDRDKLSRSIHLACRKRNVDREALETGINHIQRTLETRGEAEIKSDEIGAMVMDLLRGLDMVAYVRFASVYKEFKEAKDFQNFVGEIAGEDGPGGGS